MLSSSSLLYIFTFVTLYNCNSCCAMCTLWCLKLPPKPRFSTIIEGFEAHLHAKIVQMNLVNLFQQVRLPKNVSKTVENCKLFDNCIFNNIPQLGLLVSLKHFCHFRVDYWVCATELFANLASILNHNTSFSLKYIHQDNQI